MGKRRELTIPCRACHEKTRVRGPLTGNRMQIQCERCGYAFSLSVKHLKDKHGACEYAEGTWWTEG